MQHWPRTVRQNVPQRPKLPNAGALHNAVPVVVDKRNVKGIGVCHQAGEDEQGRDYPLLPPPPHRIGRRGNLDLWTGGSLGTRGFPGHFLRTYISISASAHGLASTDSTMFGRSEEHTSELQSHSFI